MIYIYDILLNFNDRLIEFFEWEEDDDIKYVRKIPVFSVDSNVMNDFINYDVVIDDEFVDLINKKANFYDEDFVGYENIALVCDGKMALGIKVNNNNITKVSRLLLCEEQDVMRIVERIPKTVISYKKGNKKVIKNITKFTRKELKIIEELKNEFNDLYKNNKIDKLNYYYYEYFKERSDDKECVYKSLIDSVDNDFNKRHILLYEIIKLSYKNNYTL